MGKLVGDFAELFKHGCIQTGADDPNIKLKEAEAKFSKIFFGLMRATKCDPCEGCPIVQHRCHAWQQFHEDARESRRREALRRKKAKQATKAPGTSKYPGLSVAQIAERLNISKGEVRRLKLKGEI
jgi:hypothetical protein